MLHFWKALGSKISNMTFQCQIKNTEICKYSKVFHVPRCTPIGTVGDETAGVYGSFFINNSHIQLLQ